MNRCVLTVKITVITLMRVFPKAIVLTTKSRLDVKRTYASIRGLVVRTIALGKTRISAILFQSGPVFSTPVFPIPDEKCIVLYVFTYIDVFCNISV